MLIPFHVNIETPRTAIALTIDADTYNYNIFTNRGGTYVAGTSDITLTINSTKYVGSTSTSTASLDTGTGWTPGDTIRIVNAGYLYGKGGSGATASDSHSVAGGAGGPAFKAQHACTFINTGGIVAGGGGGGGSPMDYGSGSGGGGGGKGYDGGGLGQGHGGGADGTAGTKTAIGTGGVGADGNGGDGGTLGSNGVTSGGAGGAGGYSTIGKSYINSGNGITTGTVYGTQT